LNKLYFGSHSFLKENLLEIIKENLGKNITIVVHTNKERIFLKEYLTEKLGIIYNIEFLTMIDLSKKLAKIEPLQDFDKEIILKRILQEKNPELEGLYLEFSSLIEFIKEHQLNTENLPEFIKKIINEYENFKNGKYYDREDVHILAAKKNTDFKSEVLIIYGLKSLGAVQRDVLKKIKSNTKEIYSFVPLIFDSGYYQNYEFFKKERQFFEDLTDSNAEVEKTDDKNVKTGSYIYKFDYENLPIENEDIILINPKNEIEELEYIANKINEIVENGGNFYEIGVVIPDIPKYIPFLKEIFKKYKIPYYLLEENRYIDDILYKKLFSLFKIKLENFSKKSILGFLSVDILEIIDFENVYKSVLKAPIKEGFKDLEKFIFENLEENIKNLLKEINNIPEKANINLYIDKFLEINQKFIKNEELNNFLENVLLTLKETPLYQHLFEKEISYENFVSIVETFFLEENKENKIKANTVYVLTPLSAEGNNFKHLFILNLNSAVYPPALNDEILVSSAQLDGFSHPYHILMQSLANFSALFDKNKKIYVSSLKASVNSSYLAPSVFFEELKRILNKKPNNITFTPMTLKDFSVQNSVYLLDEFENLKEKYNYLKSIENLTEEDFKYNVKVKKPVPATTFTTYAYCPYRFFFDYILKIEEDEELDRTQISPLKKGILIHNLLYDFYKSLNFSQDYLKNKKKEIEKEFEKFFEKNKPFLIPSYIPFENLKLDKLKENLFKFIEKDLERLKNNLEVATDILEKEYKDEYFAGRIDRADKDKTENYYIYDYKTGSTKDLDLTKELKDKYIQLIIYKRFLEKEGKIVKKIGIFAVNDDTGKFIYELDTEEIKEIENHLKNLIKRLGSGYFEPVKNDYCDNCPYIDFCLKDKVKKEVN
jgi:ATP-dependent helicase/DNAse subunit B